MEGVAQRTQFADLEVLRCRGTENLPSMSP
jgi:hypothetical protein